MTPASSLVGCVTGALSLTHGANVSRATYDQCTVVGPQGLLLEGAECSDSRNPRLLAPTSELCFHTPQPPGLH